jgi:hypothetical protein
VAGLRRCSSSNGPSRPTLTLWFTGIAATRVRGPHARRGGASAYVEPGVGRTARRFCVSIIGALWSATNESVEFVRRSCLIRLRLPAARVVVLVETEQWRAASMPARAQLHRRPQTIVHPSCAGAGVHHLADGGAGRRTRRFSSPRRWPCARVPCTLSARPACGPVGPQICSPWRPTRVSGSRR